MLALAGLWVLSMAIEGWYRGRMGGSQRLVLLGGAILLLFPPNHEFMGLPGYLLVLAGTLASSTIRVPRMSATGGLVLGRRA